MRASLKEVVKLKRELYEEILKKFGNRINKQRALSDSHARRRPRPCGMTIHTGVNCSLACKYCYIVDMGFKFGDVKPYPLNAYELALALVKNPYFVPGRMGTFLAFGSVTEPFLPETRDRTLEYIEVLSEILGNPIQFSTKMTLDDEAIERLSAVVRSGASVSPLITIVTLSKWREIEPRAPSPEERFETVSKLRKAGLQPVLFVRPIIPSVTDADAPQLLKLGKESGAVGVVFGTLRVTEDIIKRLATAIDVRPILERSPKPLPKRRQVNIKASDIKRKLERLARDLGLLVWPGACCANAYVAKVPCANVCYARGTCYSCPNKCLKSIPEVDEGDLEAGIRELTGKSVKVRVKALKIVVRGGRLPTEVIDMLQTVTRRVVELK